MPTDGRADMTKLIVAFRNFGNAPGSLNRVTVCACALLDAGNGHALHSPFLCPLATSGDSHSFEKLNTEMLIHCQTFGIAFQMNKPFCVSKISMTITK